jgi:hypothetical protein
MGWQSIRGKAQCKNIEGPDGKPDPNALICWIQIKDGTTIEKIIHRDETTGAITLNGASKDLGKQSPDAMRELNEFIKEYLKESGWKSH